MGDLACPAPSLGPHYRAFIATTGRSAPVPRIGTLPCGVCHLRSSLSTTRGPTSPHSTGRPYRGDRFSCSMPGPATSSRHLYTGHHQGHIQAAPWLGTPATARRCPGNSSPRFRCHHWSFDASAVVHTRSSSRRLPDPLVAGLFRSRFPPRLLTGMTLRGLGSPPARRTRRAYSITVQHVRSGDPLHVSTPLQDTHRTGLLPWVLASKRTLG